MTSKNSFWASSRENHKRRIWVWVVAVMSQMLVYSSMTMIYLSRIKNQYEMGAFRTVEAFRQAMYQAARDALAFSDNLWPVIVFLGAVIGMQGFSYLYDRRKVDMYHSVPVSKQKRFWVIYVNGIIIYLTGNLVGLTTGTVIAAAQRAVNVDVLANQGLAFVKGRKNGFLGKFPVFFVYIPCHDAGLDAYRQPVCHTVCVWRTHVV